MMDIHYLLKAGRRASAYSLREAARLVSIPPATLYRYEEGIIEKIPPQRVRILMHFYAPFLCRFSDRLMAAKIQESWYRLAFAHPEVTPEYLYAFYQDADFRGREAILEFLKWQSLYGSQSQEEV